MSLPAITISFSQLRTHFGDTNPVVLSDYYTSSPANLTSGLLLPSSSNNPISLSAFRGKTLNRGQLLRRRFTINSTTTSLSTDGFDQAFATLQQTELVPVSNFAIPANDFIGFEYTGWLVPTVSGVYTFGLTSDDGSDMALYDTSTNAWSIVTSAYGYKPPEASPPAPGTRTLTAYQSYPIRIRFHEQGGGEALSLLWIPPGSSTYASIPFTNFRCSSSIRAEAFPNPSNLLAFFGLFLYLDPLQSQSYSGSGATINNLEPTTISCTLGGTYSYSNGTIRLTNTSGNRLENTSYLQIPTLNNIRTISIWYYIHSTPADARYIVDARNGADMGYVYSGGFGSVWTQFYVNGGTAVNTSDPNIINTLVNQTGVWKNINF